MTIHMYFILDTRIKRADEFVYENDTVTRGDLLRYNPDAGHREIDVALHLTAKNLNAQYPMVKKSQIKNTGWQQVNRCVFKQFVREHKLVTPP